MLETGLHSTNFNDAIKPSHSIHSLPSLDHDNDIKKVHIYNDNKGPTKGSSVAIVISEELQKHIIKATTFKSRILTIDLSFKGNHFIRFLGCYLPANASEDKNLIISCYKEMERIYTNAKLNHYQIITLGDLNIDLDKIKHSNHYPSWRREIKNIFKNFDLKDTLKYFHQKPSPTHTSIRHQSHNILSRIDYILVSPHILDFTFHAYTHNVSDDLFTTDHKCVGCYLTQDYFKN